MLGPIFVFSLLGIICLGALVRPHVGVIGYYGFVLLQPQWNWRWSLPADFPYQKYIALTTIIGFLMSGMAGNRLQGQTRTACLSLLTFLGIAFLSAQQTVNQASTDFYMENLWKMVLMAVLGAIVLDTPKKIVGCLVVMVLAQGYNAYQINLQYFQDGYSLFSRGGWGDGGDNNLYSILTVPLMAVSASMAVYASRWWQQAALWGIFVLQSHQIMLLESRGCMLGGAVMAVVFFWLAPKSKLNVTAIVIAGTLVAALAGPPVVKEFASAFAESDELDSSAASRYKLWEAGWAITTDYPILGVGPYAGQYLVPEYYPGGLNQPRKGLHNLIFELSTGCGIPATAAYLVFFVLPWLASVRGARRARREPTPKWAACVNLAVSAGLVGYWASSLFSSGALLESSYACAAVGLAVPSVMRRTEGHEVSLDIATPDN